MIRVVDNKPLDMTNDEFEMFNKICKSHSTMAVSGENLFIDLFESDKDGVIIFLKPPSTRRTTLEAFLFLVALFNHQHMRKMHVQIDDCVKQIKEKLSEVK